MTDNFHVEDMSFIVDFKRVWIDKETSFNAGAGHIDVYPATKEIHINMGFSSRLSADEAAMYSRLIGFAAELAKSANAKHCEHCQIDSAITEHDGEMLCLSCKQKDLTRQMEEDEGGFNLMGG